MRGVKGNIGVWQQYGSQLKVLREQGLSLQAIGDKVGVTNERIRQLLKKHYGTAKVSRVGTRIALAVSLGCNPYKLKLLEKQGILHPIHSGGRYLYSHDEAVKAIVALQRYCKHCGEPLPPMHCIKYCLKCARERKRYNYPFLSEEARKKGREARNRYALKMREHKGITSPVKHRRRKGVKI